MAYLINNVGTVTGIVTGEELTETKQDITVLALREAVTENRVAYTSPSSFIDHFQDGSGIGSETNADRDASEFIDTDGGLSAGVGPWISDANTLLLLHMEDAGLTDSSGDSRTMTVASGCSRVSNQAKFGTYSAYFDGTANGSLYPPAHSDFAYGTGAYTVEFWLYYTSTQTWASPYATVGAYSESYCYKASATSFNFYAGNGSSAWSPVHGATWAASAAASTWHHLAVTRDGSNLRAYHNGVQSSVTSAGSQSLSQNQPKFGDWTGVGEYIGWIDEARISDVCRYPNGDSFTPNYGMNINTKSATGTSIGTANVPDSPKSKVSGVMLYKDAYGTATPGTHLKIYFTCDGGSNWTEAVSYTAVTPVFSTGIKMVKLGETTCTQGSDVRYKAVWASQAINSLDTQLHGIGINY